MSDTLSSANAPAPVAAGAPSLHTRFVPVAALDAATQARMEALYLAHYDGSSAALFAHDLAHKDEVLLVQAGETLIGFTTLRVFEHLWQGERLRVVYSGDTVVDRAHWGQQALAFAWIRHVGRLQRAHPHQRMVWLLIVKGHRTYRYLPAFAHSFHPHWRAAHPDLEPLADALGRRLFGADYNPDTGVVEFAQSRGHLKAAYAQPDAREREREAVRYFLARNPGYLRGHELVCLCEITPDNLKPLARRLFDKDAHAD